MKHLTLKTATLIFGLATSSIACANTFKLAMVEDSQWSQSVITKGDLQQGADFVPADALSYFEFKMATCVSNLMASELEQAKIDCQSALDGVANLPVNKATKNKYYAFSLSNLAVVNYMQENFRLAYSQFTQAKQVYDHKVTVSNMLTFNELMTQNYLLAKN
ncbi:hypothetical protein [Paraferrimonas sp. SM1919]|uniref:hypothetical protein n=1 Tax=Paraferrimonas sp. SM1919 TaxID=2662263 RepID=UPI0013D419D6|nr:hypothetical protein [Paraferrimonas sp. SM1919]